MITSQLGINSTAKIENKKSSISNKPEDLIF